MKKQNVSHILYSEFHLFYEINESVQKTAASSGNRTRAARMAGEHSTTEPTMLAGR